MGKRAKHVSVVKGEKGKRDRQREGAKGVTRIGVCCKLGAQKKRWPSIDGNEKRKKR